MAVDMFINIDGIKGESGDAKHKGEIDVLSWSFGGSQSGSAHVGGGLGAGKVNIHDLSVTKYVDKASPELFTHLCNGKHIPKALLTVRKAGEHPLEYLKITMENVLVSSLTTGGSGGEDRLTENVSLNFAKLKVEYTPQSKTGTGEGVVAMTWDILANKP